MVRYQHDTIKGRSVAVFPSGTRLTVRATRARSYPGLQGPAPSTAVAYDCIAARLSGRAQRVADLGCGAGAGSAILAAAGYEVVGCDDSHEALGFARGFAGTAPRFVQSNLADLDGVADFDALVAVDVLGFGEDDEALLYALARRARAGQTMLGAVARADVARDIEAPIRRNYSPEQLDALLVRSGWTQPIVLGLTDELVMFETTRAASLEVANVLRPADGLDDSEVIERLAAAARRADGAAEAREILLALGNALLARDEVTAAEEAFTSANAIAPNTARPIVALGRAAFARDAHDDAEALCDHALGIDPTDADAWKVLAEIFVARGEHDRGAEVLECAAMLAPSDAELASRLSGLLAESGDVEGAARALERPLAYGGSAKVHAAYGWLAASAQRSAFPSTRVASGRHARVTHTPAAHVLAS